MENKTTWPEKFDEQFADLFGHGGEHLVKAFIATEIATARAEARAEALKEVMAVVPKEAIMYEDDFGGTDHEESAEAQYDTLGESEVGGFNKCRNATLSALTTLTQQKP